MWLQEHDDTIATRKKVVEERKEEEKEEGRVERGDVINV